MSLTERMRDGLEPLDYYQLQIKQIRRWAEIFLELLLLLK